MDVPILPNTDKPVVVIHSGGLDSTTVLLTARERYNDPHNLHAISFIYGQRQAEELKRAKAMCFVIGAQHQLVELNSLGGLVKNVSANIEGTDIKMPTIKEVLGDPAPVTYVPNRNMIMFSIAAAYAEAIGAEVILCGLQSNDEYNYHDTTERWLDKLNDLLSENRKNQIKIYAPLIDWNKTREVAYLKAQNWIYTLYNTLTCYNPNFGGQSCGQCPSCAERIKGFMENGIKDPLEYAVPIDWK